MIDDQGLMKLLHMVDEATDELIGLEQDLVRIQSVNTGAPDGGHETEVCRLLKQRFDAEGITNLTLELVFSSSSNNRSMARGTISPRWLLRPVQD